MFKFVNDVEGVFTHTTVGVVRLETVKLGGGVVGLRSIGLGGYSFPFEVRAVALHYYFFKIIKIDLNTDFVSNCHIKYLSIQVVHISWDLVHLLNLLVLYSWLHFLDVFFYLLQIVGFEVYHVF